MLLFLFQQEASKLDSATYDRIFELFLASLVTGFITWLFTRRKTESEAMKNESDIIKNYIDAIGDLQQDIDVWIAKVKELRKEVEQSELDKSDLRKAARGMDEEEEKRLVILHRAFREEKDKIILAVNTTLKLVSNILEELKGYPDSQVLRMEAVRITELLYGIKEKLGK